MTKWPYKPGDALAICDTCGLRFYLSQLRKDSDGFMVCETCYDPEHPQEKIKVIRERNNLKDLRPEGTATQLSPGDVTREDL